MTLSVHHSTTIRALQPDFRSASWRRALARALESYPPHAELDCDGEHVVFVRWQGEPYASPLLVACIGSCGSREAWHRVDWTVDGLTCDCPARYPCRHRARAWAEWDGSWKKLKAWQRLFGAAAAVAGIVWLETRDADACLVRPLAATRVIRHDDGRVEAWAGWHPVRPSGRFSSGFEFGYRGSGPNELAYCILAHYYGPALAEERRSYLVDYLERVPIDAREFLIPIEAIRGAAHGEEV
ncbi:MAG: hypothetical protein RMJ05_03905 [Thermomicrobium sp.]|nr:hypothetical protein [Thermomicrobium sp.]MDW8005841.1 hypothetical protein [Thermomicrobium sp.]